MSRKKSGPIPPTPPPRDSDDEEEDYDRDVTKDNLKLLSFFWDAENLRLCETSSQKEADKRRSGLGYIFGRKTCFAPDFMKNIEKYLNKYTEQDAVDVVAISTVEKTSDSYFHREYLQESMGEIGYVLFHRSTLNNIGDGDNSLRLSIYIRSSIEDEFTLERNRSYYFFGHDGYFESTCKLKGRNSGFLSINLGHPYFGTISINSVCLPDSNKMMKGVKFSRYRTKINAINDICLTNMMEKLDENIIKESTEHLNVFIMGNFNYLLDEKEATKRDESLLKYDDFTRVKRDVLGDEFKEGVDNEGPKFQPTWSLRQDRKGDCQVGDTLNDGIKSLRRKCYVSNGELVGWKSRIVYGTYEGSTYKTTCMLYKSYDVGNIKKSGETAIIGVFELSVDNS